MRVPALCEIVTTTPSPSHDPRLVEGIETFNEGRHWHAHEAWEGVWMDTTGPDRDFVQGLIMAAAMLVHYARGNPKGVANHWRNVQERLPRHAPKKWGIDVARLLGQLELFADSANDGGALELDPKDVQIQREGTN